MEAGTDMAKPQGIDKPESIARVLSEVPGPFIATLSQAAGPAHASPTDLEKLGVAAATLPSLALFAAARAVRESMSILKRDRHLDNLQDRLLPLDDYYGVVRLKEQWDAERLWEEEASRLAGKAAPDRQG